MYYLFESSIGFILFKGQTTDIATLKSPEMQKDLQNYEKVKSIIAFENSMLFQGHNVATKTVETLMKGKLTNNLIKFLKLTFKKNSKKKLALQDKTLASVIKSKFNMKV